MDQGETYIRSLPKSLKETLKAGGPDHRWQGDANAKGSFPKGQHKGQRKGQGKGQGKGQSKGHFTGKYY